MREIKFRAWDKKRKRMFDVTTLNASGAVSVFIDDELYLLPAEQIELMQYTGFKDKNGKKICEGDIVHITPYFKKKDRKRFMAQESYRNPLSVIEWDDDTGAFSENTYEKGEFQIGGFLFEIALDSEILEGTQRHIIEVIGNIHENPELLEGKR